MLKVLGVNGSLRANSYGRRALAAILQDAQAIGAEVRILDLREAVLPLYDPDAHTLDPNVARVKTDVAWAEAFVLSSPDYHGSMSGAIKNFFDYHWSEFSGKLFAYLCASDEKGLTVMEQMRTAVRQCYGWSLPYNVSIHGKEDFDTEGKIQPGRLHDRLKMTARDLVTYGKLIRTQFVDDVTKKTPGTFAARYS